MGLGVLGGFAWWFEWLCVLAAPKGISASSLYKIELHKIQHPQPSILCYFPPRIHLYLLTELKATYGYESGEHTLPFPSSNFPP